MLSKNREAVSIICQFCYKPSSFRTHVQKKKKTEKEEKRKRGRDSAERSVLKRGQRVAKK